jgi:hypothetical protein
VRETTKLRTGLYDKSFAIPTGYIPNKKSLLDALTDTSRGFPHSHQPSSGLPFTTETSPFNNTPDVGKI